MLSSQQVHRLRLIFSVKMSLCHNHDLGIIFLYASMSLTLGNSDRAAEGLY